MRLRDFYWMQWGIYQASQVPNCVLIAQHLADHPFFQQCLTQQSYDPHVDMLLNTMLMAVEPILQSPLTCMQRKGDYILDGIRDQLYWLTDYIDDLARLGKKSE